MRKVIVLFCSLLLVLPSRAERVTPQRAKEVAEAFWSASASAAAADLRRIQPSGAASLTSASSGAYYIFKNNAGPGFVIVSGESAAAPILGYSFESHFPAGDIPDNLASYLLGISRQIEDIRSMSGAAPGLNTAAWASPQANTVLVDLNTPRWDQSEPYNLLTPVIDGTATYVGCTAVALGIVMGYYRWPERGIGTLLGYNTNTLHYQVPDQPLGHAYDWESILHTYQKGAYTEQQAQAVAVLMRDCSLLMESDFGKVGSFGTAAWPYNIPEPLVENMGYDNSVRYVQSSSYTSSVWVNQMKDELSNGRPVIFVGYNQNAGHTFVLDGYTSDSYFSVNWGWNGRYDGYFLLDALYPPGVGTGGSDGGFNLYQSAVIGIQKASAQDYQDVLMYQGSGLEADGRIAQNVPFLLKVGPILNAGDRPFSGEITVAVTDVDGNVVETLLQHEITADAPLEAGMQITLEEQVVITVPIEYRYRIRAYYDSGNLYGRTELKGSGSDDLDWEIHLGSRSTLEGLTTFEYDVETKLVRLESVDGVKASLWKEDKSEEYPDVCTVTGGTVEIDLSALFSGTYSIVLRYGDQVKEFLIKI